MKFAKNCVFFVDSPQEIFLAPRKIFGNSPRGLRPLGEFPKIFLGEENFLANPLKKTQFLVQIPYKNQTFGYKFWPSERVILIFLGSKNSFSGLFESWFRVVQKLFGHRFWP